MQASAVSAVAEQRPRTVRRRGYGLIAVKLVLLAAVIAALFYFGLIDLAILASTLEHPGPMALTVLVVVAATVLSSWRWYILLRLVGSEAKFWAVININFAATFASAALLGLVGGEALRALYVARMVGSQRSRAVSTIFVDRLLAAVALLLVSLTAVVAMGSGLADRRPLWFFTLMTLAVVVAVGLLLLFVNVYSGRISRLLRADERQGLLAIPARLVQALLDIAAINRRNVLGIAAGLALATTSICLTVVAIVIVATTLTPALTVLEFSFAGTMGLWANMMPITPGGFGFGEGAFEVVSRMIAGERAEGTGMAFLVFRVLALVAILHGAVALFFGLPGIVKGTPSAADAVAAPPRDT